MRIVILAALSQSAWARAVAPGDTGTGDECVQCPACLRHSDEQRACLKPIRKHDDCGRGAQEVLCTRSIYECPSVGFFFTHPLLSTSEIARLYSKPTAVAGGYTPRAQTNQARVRAQIQYAKRHLLLEQGSLVVEIGCNTGEILDHFAQLGHRVVCFEPSVRAAQAREKLGVKHTVLQAPYSASALTKAIGNDKVDLFISSHVLEHVPDLCTFMHELFGLMEIGGAVMTEVPNSVRRLIEHLPRHDHDFHVSFPTPRGFLTLMESAGFVLGDLNTFRDFETTGANGVWMRSIFFKPDASSMRYNMSAPAYVGNVGPMISPAPRDAHMGHCGITQPDVSRQCRAKDTNGTFAARTPQACAKACWRCAKCNFISFSMKESDCSWYESCPRLETEPAHTGHWTMARPRDPRTSSVFKFAHGTYHTRKPT
jgi:SAM-dependent methyltransferase